MIRRLFLLLVAGAVLWYGWGHGWFPKSLVPRYQGRLESQLNHEFAAAGLQDRDITVLRRQEHGWAAFSWIETSRRIEVTTPADVRTLIQRLKVFASHETLGVTVASHPNHTSRVTLAKWGIALHKLEIVPRKTHDSSRPSLASVSGPQAAIVIDDVGYSLATMDQYAALGIPLTFAVLPGSRFSKPLSEKARSLGFPVILHLPMQPQDMENNDPGPNGLFLTMTQEQLRQKFEKDVQSVPGLIGMNNHMGSAFTEDPEKMEWVLTWAKEKNLFFMDSRTSTKSVVTRVAHKLGMPSLVNETFLDNADEVAAIEAQLDKVIELAIKHKRTIAIGHYRRKHLVEALQKKIPDFRTRGVSFTVLTANFHR